MEISSLQYVVCTFTSSYCSIPATTSDPDRRRFSSVVRHFVHQRLHRVSCHLFFSATVIVRKTWPTPAALAVAATAEAPPPLTAAGAVLLLLTTASPSAPDTPPSTTSASGLLAAGTRVLLAVAGWTAGPTTSTIQVLQHAVHSPFTA
ncbi:hypothetical protein SAY86_011367 [Trapa natans]|uniref:Uncharacterized protein n=1 Tax=Trapa natans TaxID=22666 RepID=A0AAN7R0Q2_TRANT|nr:hypothetical protein SAY86_011367 [Trapa natans]